MTIEIVTVPCLKDNFAYLVKGEGAHDVAVVDAPEAGPIIAALAARGWTPDLILITHHHNDHVGGVEALRGRFGAAVVGPAAEAQRLPPLDRAVKDGDTLGTGEFHAEVIAVPGHTRGHVAYHFPAACAAFTADSLMAGGCGRLFEGTAEQMWDSLSRLARLPSVTRIYSGHDYLDTNLRFSRSIEPQNAALAARIDALAVRRAQGGVPMPTLLSEELATNPFLRAGLPQVKAAMAMDGATDAEVFAAIRAAKDRF